MEILIVLLVILWCLGFFSGFAFGGLIHILLIAAVVVLVLRILRGGI
jgi:hypothetical protein